MWTRLGTAVLFVVASCGVAAACDKEARSQVGSRFMLKTSDKEEARAYFGIQLGAAEEGIRILEVLDDSPAEAAGFEDDDIIVAFGGEDIDGVEHFVKLVGNSTAGEDVLVEYERDGVTRTRTITLGSRAAMPQAFDVKMFHNDWMPAEVTESLQRLEHGNVNVEVECEDGKGTATIEVDGEVVETHEFDCDEEHGNMHMFKWHGGDEDNLFFTDKGAAVIELHGHLGEMDELQDKLKNITIELDDKDFPHAIVRRGGFFGQRDREPTIRFREDSDGRIEVTIRKGDTELIKEFKNADDLERRDEELFEKYDDLQN